MLKESRQTSGIVCARLVRGQVLRGVHFALIAAILMACWPSVAPARAQAATMVQISSPTSGEVLHGSVEILGSLGGPAFLSGELAFAYAGDSSDTWFVITDVYEPVIEAPIATWNTLRISDGDYRLRLQLHMLDGTSAETIVEVQVRNYTAATVLTPAQVPTNVPLLQVGTPVKMVISPTVSTIEQSTPTPLPANTAALNTGAIFAGLWRGAMAVIAVCVLVGVLLIKRRP